MRSQKLVWIIARLAVLLCLFTAGCNYPVGSGRWNYREAKYKGIIVNLTCRDDGTEATGDWEWRSYRRGRQYSGKPVFILFQLYDASGNRGISPAATINDLIWISPGATHAEKDDDSIRFELAGPAGRWSFNGRNRFTGATGTVKFQPSSSFVDEANAASGRRPSIGELVQFSISGRSPNELREDREALRTLDSEDLIKLQSYGVTTEYAKSMKSALGSLSADELIECHNYGMTPEFAAAYSRAGYAFDHSELIRLKNFGVPPDYAAALKRGGMNLHADDLIKLHNNGVSPSFALRVRELGLGDKLDDIIAMRNSGLREDYISNIRDAGYRISREEIVKLNNYGVPADFLRAVRRMGYTFSIDQIVKLRSYGVSESYLAEIQSPGRKPLSADLIVDLHSRGVPASTVRAIRAE